MQKRNPMQPMELRNDGAVRFKPNKIVEDLLDFADTHGFGMNAIARKNYTQADREQFLQLIGYTLKGYHEIQYVSDKSAMEASIVAKTITDEPQGCREHGCGIHIGVEQE